MELADVRDSKSRGGDTVSVRPRPPAPSKTLRNNSLRFLLFIISKLYIYDFYAIFYKYNNDNFHIRKLSFDFMNIYIDLKFILFSISEIDEQKL